VAKEWGQFRPTLHGRVKEFVNGPLDPTDPSSLSIRDAYAADVIVAFATNIPFFCGYGDQRDWAGVAPSFQENPLENNLDLRGKDKYHIALVSLEFGTIDCDDRDYLVAHEFGHLLGGGHYNDPTSGRSWLYSNSRADTDTHILNWPGLGPITWYNISALGSNNNSKCGGGCIWARSYSKSLWSWDDPIRSNRLALAITATSVANYVNGNGIVGQGSSGGTTFQCSDGTDNDGDSLVDTLDSDCTGPTDDSEAGPPPPPGPPGCLPYSYVPTNLTKTLLQLCVPGTSKTEYRIRWDHACPSDALYKVYGTTAGEGTYFLTATESQSVIVRIEAPPVSGSVSVSACFGITCSALSPGIVIFDQC